MKTTRKFMAILMVFAMILSMGVLGAFAQTVGTATDGTGSITITNASKGVEYKVFKLFDAEFSNGSIVYTGSIPDGLSSIFEFNKDPKVEANKYIVAKADALGNDGKLNATAIATLQEWVTTQTEITATANAVSEGGELTIQGLDYGYYFVTSTQGSAVSVDSTNPNAMITDKNSTEPSAEKLVNGQKSDDANIGDTVTYTATFNTANYLGEGEESKKVVKYEITDTLPAGVTLGKVESITVGGKAIETQQFVDGKITIEWVDADGVSLYANGDDIVITYTATVNENAVIAGAGNVNTISLLPYVDDGNDGEPWKEHFDDSATVYTYAAALQKVDQDEKPLAGAKFAAMGLTVKKVSDGVYRVTKYNPNTQEYGIEMVCDQDGQLVILGLSEDSILTVKETAAPAGYNKLAGTTTMTPFKTSETITASETTIYYNADGKVTDEQTQTSVTKTTYNVSLLKTAVVVENQKGTELPSTGAMGTVIFIAVGSLIAVAAVCFLVTKKRMQNRGMN